MTRNIDKIREITKPIENDEELRKVFEDIGCLEAIQLLSENLRDRKLRNNIQNVISGWFEDGGAEE